MTKIKALTTDDQKLLFALLISEVDSLWEGILKEDGGWVLKIIEKRLEAHGLKTCKRTMIFILSLGEGVVGKCAKYVDDLALKAKGFDYVEIDFAAFLEKVYPDGVPDFSTEN